MNPKDSKQTCEENPVDENEISVDELQAVIGGQDGNSGSGGGSESSGGSTGTAGT